MRFLLFAVLVAACGSDKTSTPAPPTTPSKTMPAPTQRPEPVVAGSAAAAAGSADVRPAEKPADPPVVAEGHDFTAEGKALATVGACDGGTPPAEVSEKQVAKHCDVIIKTRDEYAGRWVKLARAFFEEKVPKDSPKKVVYPFAGADLSTALTVYPDADEITTMSLEPAGDPRTLGVLKGKDLDYALGKVQYELKFLYRANFSNTLNMIEAMRGGALPTQLIFGLSALKLHGFELVGVRYFSLEDNGAIHYLDDADLAKAPDPAKGSAEQRNMLFSNAEVMFRRPGGRIQLWRHIRANLGNKTSKGIGPGLETDPRVVKHLESKGPIAGMTKAASYLMSWDSFSIIRNYLLANVVWMVSDATGVAPKWGRPAGYDYETYGAFEAPHIEAGTGIANNWKTEFAAQPKRDLRFRFGYYDKKIKNHLIIMKKGAKKS